SILRVCLAVAVRGGRAVRRSLRRPRGRDAVLHLRRAAKTRPAAAWLGPVLSLAQDRGALRRAGLGRVARLPRLDRKTPSRRVLLGYGLGSTRSRQLRFIAQPASRR